VRLTLGSRGDVKTPFHPGDSVFPTFEVTTPGDVLPNDVDVTVVLTGPAESEERLAEVDASIEIPQGAVGYVVDTVELTLPLDLQPGDYLVEVEVRGDEGQFVADRTTVTVVGEPDLVRQLVGRSLVMTAFETGRPLYSAAD